MWQVFPSFRGAGHGGGSDGALAAVNSLPPPAAAASYLSLATPAPQQIYLVPGFQTPARRRLHPRLRSKPQHLPQAPDSGSPPGGLQASSDCPRPKPRSSHVTPTPTPSPPPPSPTHPAAWGSFLHAPPPLPPFNPPSLVSSPFDLASLTSCPHGPPTAPTWSLSSPHPSPHSCQNFPYKMYPRSCDSPV